MAIYEQSKTVVTDDHRRGICWHCCKLHCLPEKNMSGPRFLRSVRLIPNPGYRYRKSKLLLLRLTGNNFSRRRRVPYPCERRQRVTKLLRGQTTNCRTIENKFFLRLLTKVHGRQLV